jgi:hypothetical protein
VKTEPDPSDDHRQLFDEVARQVMAATLDFANKVALHIAHGPTLTTLDVAKMYFAAGSLVAGQTLAEAGVARLLRELADGIDRPGDRAKLN